MTRTQIIWYHLCSKVFEWHTVAKVVVKMAVKKTSVACIFLLVCWVIDGKWILFCSTFCNTHTQIVSVSLLSMSFPVSLCAVSMSRSVRWVCKWVGANAHRLRACARARVRVRACVCVCVWWGGGGARVCFVLISAFSQCHFLSRSVRYVCKWVGANAYRLRLCVCVCGCGGGDVYVLFSSPPVEALKTKVLRIQTVPGSLPWRLDQKRPELLPLCSQGFKVLLSFWPLGDRKRSYICTRHSLWTSTWVLLINNYHTLYIKNKCSNTNQSCYKYVRLRRKN